VLFDETAKDLGLWLDAQAALWSYDAALLKTHHSFERVQQLLKDTPLKRPYLVRSNPEPERPYRKKPKAYFGAGAPQPTRCLRLAVVAPWTWPKRLVFLNGAWRIHPTINEGSDKVRPPGLPLHRGFPNHGGTGSEVVRVHASNHLTLIRIAKVDTTKPRLIRRNYALFSPRRLATLACDVAAHGGNWMPL